MYDTMTTRERFRAVMNFEPFDRLPLWEWAPFWGETLERWYGEGLPRDIDLYEHFGLEWYPRDWRAIVGPETPRPESHGAGIIKDMQDYEKALDHLYPWPAVGGEVWERLTALQERGEIVNSFQLEGFFWGPRSLLGIERHLYAFFDQPELIHRINSDLADYHIKYIDEVCSYGMPDFMAFAEDMSYNNGPMLSRDCFDEFLQPYYERVVAHLDRYGILPFVDSDGDVSELASWLEGVGVRGIFPLERQAGCDINALRRDHPRMRFFGHFDKMVMHRGEAALRAEFERLLPAAARGGFIISVDHQTPPGVSYADYQLYMTLYREYAEEAGRLSQGLAGKPLDDE